MCIRDSVYIAFMLYTSDGVSFAPRPLQDLGVAGSGLLMRSAIKAVRTLLPLPLIIIVFLSDELLSK